VADNPEAMSLEPTLEDQETLADTFQRQRSRMTMRELVGSALAGGGFALAVGALWVLAPPEQFAVFPSALCVLVLALATRVQFDTPAGCTVPTQLAFVPLLFVAPAPVVPIAVVVGFLIGRLPEALKREVPPSRLIQLLGNSWFSIGPVAVFTLAHVAPAHAGAGLLLAALGAQFLLDIGIAALRDAVARGITISALAGDVWVHAIDAALSIVGLVFARDLARQPTIVLGLVPLLGVLATFARERHQRLDGLLELNRAYRGTALALGDVVEADDGYTGEHCKSVLELALAVGRQLGLDAERRRNLEFAALLHDVGKVAIPKEILNKPGKLDPDEWTTMKSHTVEGQRMLARIGGFMDDVGRLVRAHHERWDGRGYPDGLAGEEIPLEARIISCCDTWNAMRTDRAYRKALPYDVALAELVANSGSQFDPRVIEALIPVIEQHDRQSAADGDAPADADSQPEASSIGAAACDDLVLATDADADATLAVAPSLST
jgi:putative nucleotidyltransferase with HDIG domain